MARVSHSESEIILNRPWRLAYVFEPPALQHCLARFGLNHVATWLCLDYLSLERQGGGLGDESLLNSGGDLAAGHKLRDDRLYLLLNDLHLIDLFAGRFQLLDPLCKELRDLRGHLVLGVSLGNAHHDSGYFRRSLL